jgi:hypothetical protein
MDEALAKRGLTMKEARLVSFGSGIYCLKSDQQEIIDMLDRHEAELKEAMNDSDFARSAFLYEMINHEYGINWQGDWDVLSKFGLRDSVCEYGECKSADDYMVAMGFSFDTRYAYRQAVSDYNKMADEKGWW